MKNKKVSIIGGSGFIGTQLCQQLTLKKQNFEIIDLKMSRQFPKDCKIGDVRDIFSLRKSVTGDIVVNLAAVHRDDVRDKFEYERTNVIGGENVAAVCKEKGINKIVFTSSVAVYGHAQPGTDENGSIKPFNEYGRTKFAAEEKFRLWQREGQNKLIIVRPAVVFGLGNRGNVYNLFHQISSGRFIMIGDGENKKSMAYVDNLASFLEKCIGSNEEYVIYNYVDTPDLTMNELVCFVRKKLKNKDGVGLRLPYVFGMLAGYFGDFTAIMSRRAMPITSIRVKKFTSPSEFKSSKHKLNDFVPLFKLKEAIDLTLHDEFIKPKSDIEIFYSE